MTPLRVSISADLADFDVLGLGFRNLQLGLQPARVGDAGQVLARARHADRLRPAPAAARRRIQA